MFLSRASPLQALACSGNTARTAEGWLGAGTRSAEPHGLPGSPQAPPPACAAPRPRALPVRAPSCLHREAGAWTGHSGKSQIPGAEDSDVGKGDICCLGQRPTTGVLAGPPTIGPSSPPCERPLSSSRVAWLQPSNPARPRARRGRVFPSGVLCASSWLCPRQPGAKSLAPVP